MRRGSLTIYIRAGLINSLQPIRDDLHAQTVKVVGALAKLQCHRMHLVASRSAFSKSLIVSDIKEIAEINDGTYDVPLFATDRYM